MLPSKGFTLRADPIATVLLFCLLLLAVDKVVNNPTYAGRQLSHQQRNHISSTVDSEADLPHYTRAQKPLPSCVTGRAKSFLIVFLSRSGSTAICSELKAHSEIHMELLELLDKQKVPHSNVSLAISRTREFFQRGLARGRVPGYKIRAHHILTDPAAWAELVEEFETRVIWQYRKNVVKSVIGTYLREKYGDDTAISGIRKGELAGDRCSMGVGCRFRIGDIKLFHTLLKNRIRGEKQVLKAVQVLNNGRDCILELPYEDYLFQPEDTMPALQEFLGVEWQKTVSDRVKATGDNLCTVVENFDELCDTFYGCAAWQPFLEDFVNDCRCTEFSRLSSEFCSVV